MKYQLADLHNGPFGEVFETMAEAEKALAEAIKEGQEINNENCGAGEVPADASEFFCIVDADTGEEI